jgi:hypothetical protein
VLAARILQDSAGLITTKEELVKMGLCKVLRRCILDDDSEEADGMREMIAIINNGFEFIWHVMKVVVGMLDNHKLPPRPVYKGNLSRHIGNWRVHQLMQLHQGAQFQPDNCSMAFLRKIVCLHYNPAAKVELGMLKNTLQEHVRCGRGWEIPVRFEVRALAANNPPGLFQACNDGRRVGKDGTV